MVDTTTARETHEDLAMARIVPNVRGRDGSLAPGSAGSGPRTGPLRARTGTNDHRERTGEGLPVPPARPMSRRSVPWLMAVGQRCHAGRCPGSAAGEAATARLEIDGDDPAAITGA